MGWGGWELHEAVVAGLDSRPRSPRYADLNWLREEFTRVAREMRENRNQRVASANPSVSDEAALGEPTTEVEALVAWFRVFRMQPRLERCVRLRNGTLSVVVDFGEQDSFVDEFGEPYDDPEQYHTTLFEGQTMALHRLCYVAKLLNGDDDEDDDDEDDEDDVEGRIRRVQIVGWCSCMCYELEDLSPDPDVDMPHLAGKASVDLAAHPSDGDFGMDAFMDSVRITLYDPKERRWLKRHDAEESDDDDADDDDDDDADDDDDDEEY
mmetsp:Transcript_22849/g.70210  ORF Transcript_22849/g.70210 Transcript_22849/m.70210 type:complete len:266 (-) Transcript_22849:79-876(-)